jgi:hypothetical protein
VSKKPKEPRCDSCNKRIRRNQHELLLIDPLTGQRIGHYHAMPDCMRAAAKYFKPGTVTMSTFVHPDRCGDDLEECDGGLPEWAA